MKDFDYKKIIEGCIVDLINTYCDNPFVYIMESDIQARLFAMLFDELIKEDKKFIKKINISSEIKRKWPDKEIQSTVLHCELPVLKGQHLDIGIWDESELATASKDAREAYKSKKINYAIEIKYNWQCSLTEGLKGEIEKDFSKVNAAGIETAFFLCFLARDIENINEESNEWAELLRKFGRKSYKLYITTPEKAYKLHTNQWFELNKKKTAWTVYT